MYPHLTDIEFLNKLFKARIREQYTKLVLLDFFEKPIKEIQGIATAGSVSVNGSSAVRRTVNLTLSALAAENDLTDIDNLISINKKVRIEVGLRNPFQEYIEQYGKIIWFPQGVFVLATASCALSTSGCNISITGKDKMAKLDGTAGGVFPASVTITKREEQLTYGKIDITIPTMAEIILEAVHHYGEEPVENIFIENLDIQGKQQVQYIGEDPIHFSENYSSFVISNADSIENYPNKYEIYQNVGYCPTPLTYPSDKDLVLSAGETVVSLLDKFAKALGNYEFYYDVFGKFHFRMITNYKTTNSPLENLTVENYFKQYGDDKYEYAITDADSLISINSSPKLDNIKNDFLVWGSRGDKNGGTFPLRYHAVIAEKPKLNLINEYYLKGLTSGNLLVAKNYFANQIQITEEEDLWNCSYQLETNSIIATPQISIKAGEEWLHPLQFSNLIFEIKDQEDISEIIWSSFKINEEIYTGKIYMNNYKKQIAFPEDFFGFISSNGQNFSDFIITENNYQSPIEFFITYDLEKIKILFEESKTKISENSSCQYEITQELPTRKCNIIFSVKSTDKEISQINIASSGKIIFDSNENFQIHNIPVDDFQEYSIEVDLKKSSDETQNTQLIFLNEENIEFEIKNLKIVPVLIFDNNMISYTESNNIVPPAPEGGWREELYRQALLDEQTGTTNVFEQAELIAEWRKLFDPLNKSWEDGWNPKINEDPSMLDYWLDYIDLPKYSINAIGRRTKTVSDDKIKAIQYTETPDIVFVANTAENRETIKQLRAAGENVFQVQQTDMNFFSASTTGASALDKIRELIQTHLTYNNSLSITCTPLYYLEPNKMIHIENKKLGINGNYAISQFTVPLTYNGTMSITATEIIQSY